MYQTPPQQPKRRGKFWLIFALVAGVLVFSCVICSAIASSASDHAQQTLSANVTPTVHSSRTVTFFHKTATPVQSTQQPSRAATEPPTSTTASGIPLPAPGPTVLGQSLSHFLARYGPPTDSADMQRQSDYSWNHSSLDAFAYQQDHYLVNGILFSGSNGNGWNSVQEAVSACRVFLPSDAVYKRSMTFTSPNTDEQRVYVSQSLAQLFPVSRFTDENGDVTTAGTFAIVYGYDATNVTHVDQCSVQVGLQGK